ncbi:hypothetical protein ETAC_12950 [Edwardsiella piscicida C07-087]|nr:hypothetical protein ETAC_12950 [Edwardsiella piscicida C07-087]
MFIYRSMQVKQNQEKRTLIVPESLINRAEMLRFKMLQSEGGNSKIPTAQDIIRDLIDGALCAKGV